MRTATRGVAFFASLLIAVAVAGPASAMAPADDNQARREPVPVWVEDLEVRLDELAEPEPGVEVRRILVDDQLRVPDAGEGVAERFSRMVYSIDDRAALDNWSTWSIDFEPSFQTLVLHRLSVYRDGAWSDRLDRSRQSILHRQEDLHAQIFDQTRTLFLIIDDLRPGDLVDIAYSLRGSNPILGDQYATTYSLGSFVPTLRRHLRWILGPEREWRYRTFGGLGEPDRSAERAGMKEIVWDLIDPPLEEYEFDVPPDESVQPWVQLTSYGSWAEVIDWKRPYYAIGDLPAELERRVEVWRNAGGTLEDQVLAARGWVQENIRYFAVVVGEHSHRPHALDEITSRRYGDCKDKTLTLLALLDRLGVDAWPVTVNTTWENGIEEWLPSPWAFDHVIVGFELEGERYWIDPTLSPQGGTRLAESFVPRYRTGLPIRAAADGLEEIPLGRSHPGVETIAFDYRLNEKGTSYEVAVETQRTGRKADHFREQIASTTLDDLLESYVDYYSGPGQTLEGDPLVVEDDRRDNRLVVRERYTVMLDGEVLEDFETLPLEISALLDLPDDMERERPMPIPYPLEHRESIALEVPVDLDLEPIEESIDNPWFEFEATSTIETGKIRIDYFLRTKTDRVAPEDLAAYADDVETFWTTLGYWIGDVAEVGAFAAIAASIGVVLSLVVLTAGIRWSRLAA